MKFILLALATSCLVLATAAQPAVLNYTSYQSPVKHQGSRNTCSGFAVAACLETFAGVPADVSEQHIYAGLKMLEYKSADPVDQGGRLNIYPQTLSKYGVMHESKMPYNRDQLKFSVKDDNLVQVIRESQSGPISMLMNADKVKVRVDAADCEVAEFDAGLSVANIKRLLQQGVKAIGIGYYVNEYWFDWEYKRNLLITPDSVGGFVDTSGNKRTFKALKALYGNNVFAYINDVFKGGGSKRWYYSSNREEQGHAVTIVGYNADGFIIKNSWGAEWGSKGYATVSYDYHTLFAKRMLAIKKVHFIAQQQRTLTPLTDLRLKLVPNHVATGGLGVSLFCLDEGYDPSISQVTYSLYKVTAKGKTLVDKRISLPGIREYDNSFATIFVKAGPTAFLSELDASFQVEVAITARNIPKPVMRIYKNIKWANGEYKATP